MSCPLSPEAGIFFRTVALSAENLKNIHSNQPVLVFRGVSEPEGQLVKLQENVRIISAISRIQISENSKGYHPNTCSRLADRLKFKLLTLVLDEIN